MVSPVYELIKIIASVYQTGGDYFLCDLLPSVYPSSKQVKPKPNTAMRQDTLIKIYDTIFV